jgi:hypothetical protein
MADLRVTIAEHDLGDFYQMLRDFRRNRGNTFAYLQIELEQRYPKLKERYGTTPED